MGPDIQAIIIILRQIGRGDEVRILTVSGIETTYMNCSGPYLHSGGGVLDEVISPFTALICNATDFEVSCTVPAFEGNITAGKAPEALWIITRDSRMNNRNKQLSITRNIMLFFPSCAI